MTLLGVVGVEVSDNVPEVNPVAPVTATAQLALEASPDVQAEVSSALFPFVVVASNV